MTVKYKPKLSSQISNPIPSATIQSQLLWTSQANSPKCDQIWLLARWGGTGRAKAAFPHSIRTPSALRNWSSATQGAHIAIKYKAGKESLPTTGWQKQISAGRLDKALVVGSAGLCGLGSRQMTP